MIAYFYSKVVGPDEQHDATRPAIGDEPGMDKWESCYRVRLLKKMKPKEALIRVYADEGICLRGVG